MTALITILSIILLFVVLLQIAKINEITAEMRGQEQTETHSANQNGKWLLIFGVVFLGSFFWGSLYYANRLLGYGPLKAASEHGGSIDSMFNVTLIFTGIVFLICHVALFWFSYKFRYTTGKKALFLPHDNRLEVIWTALPALVMTILVVQGLVTWNKVMADVTKGEDFIEIEATGWQFAWNLRYPGQDGKLGVKDFRLIKPGVNELGQDWNDDRNHDDFNADELVIPKGKKIRVRITARDVLHNFYLPHFRVKMDAVPGIPTYFIFTPIKTTEEFRQELRKYPEYQMPSDPNDPASPPKWKTFEYELACAELCGKGHYSMRRLVKVVSPEEWEIWNKKQKSYYLSSIRNTDEDPLKGKAIKAEAFIKTEEMKSMLLKALDSTNTNAADRIIRLDNIYFETGSATLDSISEMALNVLKETFDQYPKLKVEVSGHTDNTGAADLNLKLSNERATAIKNYLVSKGVSNERISALGNGSNKPVDTNDTDEGRAKNRRIEFKILSF
ncbi:MAG: OmpA family protein [Saprospiraceae bacterium]